jgi:hypothetical protein
MYEQVDLRLGRPDLVHEVLQTIEVNSGIALTSTTLAMDQTGRGDRSNSSFFTMNLSNSTSNGRAVAHCNDDDDITGADDTVDCDTTVHSYDRQSSDVPSTAVTAGNGSTGSASATSNSRSVVSIEHLCALAKALELLCKCYLYRVVLSYDMHVSRSERQGSGDTVATANTATLSVDSRVIANSDDLFRKYDGLQDILASNDNLRKKVNT